MPDPDNVEHPTVLATTYYITMLTTPRSAIIDTLKNFVLATGGAAVSGSQLPSFRLGGQIIVIGAAPGRSPSAVAEWLRVNKLAIFDDPDAYEIIVVLVDAILLEDLVIARGVRLSSMHRVVAEVSGLPRDWRTTVDSWVDRALEPVTMNGVLRLAKIYAVSQTKQQPAGELVDSWMFAESRAGGRILYLRAEAGKGKSTVLADAVRRGLAQGRGGLPVYVPLRLLRRDVGVSWADVATQLGVVGDATNRFALAVKHGLVALVLDGLDEVAGRYDPNVVQAVIGVVSAELVGIHSRVILSGRTTEAGLLDPARSHQIGLELPAPAEAAFREYVHAAVHYIVPMWPELARRIPEPPQEARELPATELNPQQEEVITEWIARVFEEFGKDRSLFFVQSLACIGRTYQLDGNQPLVIDSGGRPQVADASLYEVCILAAALACVREQDKLMDEGARQAFAPAPQLEFLTWLALRATSGEDALRQLPSPQELASTIFSVDPVHQYEEFTAILRQMQKHALLFSGHSSGLKVGDWRPQFLSEWVRGALLCRAWNCATLGDTIDPALIERAVASAERSRIAFQYIFAEHLRHGQLRDPERLIELCCSLADADSPEAAANYWTLVAGAGQEQVGVIAPESIPPMADLSDLAFEGVELSHPFSATLAFFGGSQLTDCSILECAFDQCEFVHTTFVGVKFEGVTFRNCDGPMYFEACEFKSTGFENCRATRTSAFEFNACTFDDCHLVQEHELVLDQADYRPTAIFRECEGGMRAEIWMSGALLGFDPRRIEGYTVRGAPPVGDPVHGTLRAVLDLFFPRRAGEAGQLQARRYIRSSAVGRGRMPQGAPSGPALIEILMSEGFTDGGRDNHVFAPWSSVVGARAAGVEMRNELLDYLRNGRESSIVHRLLAKIRRAGEFA